MHKWMIALLGLLLLVFLGGCAATLTNQGEVGFRYGTEFTFFHRASETSEEPAKSELEVPALVDWVVGDKDDQVVEP